MTAAEILGALAGLMVICSTLHGISGHWSQVRIARHLGHLPDPKYRGWTAEEKLMKAHGDRPSP
jgi:hypothetical protein